MASTSSKEVKLSPRESRLVSALRKSRGWLGTAALAEAEFGSPGKWPINARAIVRLAVATAEMKYLRAKGSTKIVRRGNGGRGGIEFKIENGS